MLQDVENPKPAARAAKLIALSLCLAGLLPAQSTFGTFVGTVTDTTGAVVPNAKIIVTDQAEGISRELRTNAQGDYEALNMKASVYTVSAEAAGFKPFRQEKLHLDARQTLRVDVKLEIGQLSDTVTVKAGAPTITTDTQTIAATFSTDEVLSLPTNYRGAGSTSPLRVLSYLPGVQSDNSYGFSVQGGLPSQSQVSLDGISTLSTRVNGPLVEMFPSTESIAEIKVQGVGNNAEFGEVGDITTTSKAGGNDYHGSAYEYLQNRFFDATSYGSVTKPQKTANDFGGSFGGHVIRNRTFFFATYEQMEYRTGTTIQNTVPTAAMRVGDFSKQAVIKDPLTNAPFPNQQIPVSEISTAANAILKYYPLPNFGSTAVEANNNYRINEAAPITSKQYDIRVDHLISSRQFVFARFSWKNLDATTPNSLLLPPDTTYDYARSLVVAYNFTITPRVVNEFRAGYTYDNQGTGYNFDGNQIVTSLGLTGLAPRTYIGFPSFTFSSGTTSIGKANPGFQFTRTTQFNDNLTWTKGRHTMKFGYDIRRLRTQSPLPGLGGFTFGGQFSGSDVADFLIGLPNQSTINTARPDTNGLTWHYGAFAQDSFKATPKLTLEYGLRWEYHPAFTDAGSDITGFDQSVPVTGRIVIPSSPAAQKLTAPGFLASINSCPAPTVVGLPCTPFITAQQAGWPENLRFPWKKDFDPRIGFAYRPFNDNKTVIRGGFGMYTMLVLGNVFFSVTGVSSNNSSVYTNSVTNGKPLFQFPFAVPQGPGGLAAVTYGTVNFNTAVDPHFRDPYSMQWNLSVDRQLSLTTGLRVSYIAMQSVHLPWSTDVDVPQPSTTPFAQRPLTDRPFPYWTRVSMRESVAIADYQSMQVEVNHRIGSGLTFDSAWTWAKNLSDAEGPSTSAFAADSGGGVAANALYRAGDYGNVGPTRRHRWVNTAHYDLPFGRGKRFGSTLPKAMDALAGGWQLSGILLAETGPYLTATFSGGDPSGTDATARGSQRPDVIPGADGNLSDPTASMWLNRSAFVCPGRVPGSSTQFNCNVTPIGRFGDAGPGTLLGPATFNLSMGASKSFRIAEHGALKFQATYTNLLNHPNLGDPGTDITSLAFGQITQTRGADSGGNRTGQFSLRYEF